MVKLLREKLHSKLLELRSLYRFISTEVFQSVYEKVDENQKSLVAQYLEKGDSFELRKWFKLQLKVNQILEEVNVGELRKLCVDLGVKDYRYMTKASLITAIRNKEIQNERNCIATDCVPS